MAVKIIDINSKIAKGKVFMVAHTFDSVAKNESVYLRHTTGTKKELHSILCLSTAGQWRFTSYVGTEYTDDGIEIEPINRHSNTSKTLDSIFRYAPVVTTPGTPRLDFKFGYGEQVSRAVTSQMNEKLESIFTANTDVLIKLTNESGATQYLSAIFDVYEE